MVRRSLRFRPEDDGDDPPTPPLQLDGGTRKRKIGGAAAAAAATTTTTTAATPVAAEQHQSQETPKKKSRGGGAAAVGAKSDNTKSCKEKDEEEEEKEDKTKTTTTVHYDKGKVVRAFDLLIDAGDLPSVYAALKIIKDLLDGADPPEEYEEITRQASLAVPFLMYTLAVEHFTRPRSYGGLAFSTAKAQKLAKQLFEGSLGLSCCAESLDESTLIAGHGIPRADARKILPKLKQVGQEARSKVEETKRLLEETTS